MICVCITPPRHIQSCDLPYTIIINTITYTPMVFIPVGVMDMMRLTLCWDALHELLSITWTSCFWITSTAIQTSTAVKHILPDNTLLLEVITRVPPLFKRCFAAYWYRLWLTMHLRIPINHLFDTCLWSPMSPAWYLYRHSRLSWLSGHPHAECARRREVKWGYHNFAW